MKVANVRTVQGVGDIFWVYQKLSPYYDKINLEIMMVSDDTLQRRATQFVELLPKVGSISYVQVSENFYHSTIKGIHPLQDKVDKDESFIYSVNWPLEQGIRLEGIDPGMKVEWDVKFNVSDEKPVQGDYLVFYVSGAATAFWPYRRWGDYAQMIYEALPVKMPFVLTGAPFDSPAINEIAARLTKYRIPHTIEMSRNADLAIRLIKNAKFYVGYQSGLGIIADNYDVPQIMVYFDYLKPMLYTWCKPQNVKTIFNAFNFGDLQTTINSETKQILSRLLAPATVPA